MWNIVWSILVNLNYRWIDSCRIQELTNQVYYISSGQVYYACKCSIMHFKITCLIFILFEKERDREIESLIKCLQQHSLVLNPGAMIFILFSCVVSMEPKTWPIICYLPESVLAGSWIRQSKKRCGTKFLLL